MYVYDRQSVYKKGESILMPDNGNYLHVPGSGPTVTRNIPKNYIEYYRYTAHTRCFTPIPLMAIPDAILLEILGDMGYDLTRTYGNHSSSSNLVVVSVPDIPVINITKWKDEAGKNIVVLAVIKGDKTARSILWDDTIYRHEQGVLYYRIRKLLWKIKGRPQANI